VRAPPVPDGGEELPIGVAQRRTVDPVTEQQPGLCSVPGHPPQVICHAASDAALRGVVLAQHGDKTRLVLADQLRVDGRGEGRFVREVVVQRADAHLGLAPDVVQRGHECAIGREPAPRHPQQPVPRV